jgi:hypothetical protein
LGPRKAVSIATEFVHKFFPESTDPPLDEIDMRHVGHKSQWIYLVLFKLRSQPGWTRTLDFPVVVLMDGRVVEPRVVPNGESKPFISVSLRKATVVEALTVYRECAGGPLTPAELKISTDVPVGAEISVESQSASNTEMQRIIEKALREQAGVVLTRGAPNQFSVTYDPTVKTSSAK